MPAYHVVLNPFALCTHLDSLTSEAPKDRRGYERAKERAAKVVQGFEASRSAQRAASRVERGGVGGGAPDDEVSQELAQLEDGARWSGLVMRMAYVHHGVTIDDLTPDVLRDVARRFAGPDNTLALAHWVAVVHEELVAFFRFLAGEGFIHAEANLEILEEEILPRVDAELETACSVGAKDLSIEPLDEAAKAALLASGKFTAPRDSRIRPIDSTRRLRRKAQRAARRRNR